MSDPRLPQVFDADDPPVTCSVCWKARPHRRAEFERILDGMVEAALAFEGHLGVNVFHPSGPDDTRFHVVVKFDSLSHFRRWELSDERGRWLSAAAPFVLDPPTVQVLTGLETWFALPDRPSMVAPARYKMWLLTWLAVFPIVVLVRATLGPPFLDQLPLVVQALVLSGVLVPTMIFLVMPRMTRLFAGWLYPSTHLDEHRGPAAQRDPVLRPARMRRSGRAVAAPAARRGERR